MTTIYMITGAATLIALIAIYFVPAIIAYWRGHPSLAGIVVVNLLLGWTFLGWVGALVWAVTSAKQQVVYQQASPAPQADDDRVRCPDCKELILRGATKCRYCGALKEPS